MLQQVHQFLTLLLNDAANLDDASQKGHPDRSPSPYILCCATVHYKACVHMAFVGSIWRYRHRQDFGAAGPSGVARRTVVCKTVELVTEQGVTNW